MRCILMEKEAFDEWALANADEPVFNEADEYRYFEEFDPFHSRDQIKYLIEEYVAKLKGAI